MSNLIQFIEKQIHPGFPIAADTCLLSTGLINSFDFGSFLMALETQFEVCIDLASVGANNFDTPRQISQYIDGLK